MNLWVQWSAFLESESAVLNPSSPYRPQAVLQTSRAGFHKTMACVVITRCSNNYGLTKFHPKNTRAVSHDSRIA